MKNILILGAGFSSTVMIKYLLEKSSQYNWNITVGDMNLALAEKKNKQTSKRKSHTI